jgi:hypothetical protein
MKTIRTRSIRRRHDLLREFFACAVVIAAIKSDQPRPNAAEKVPAGPSPSGRV